MKHYEKQLFLIQELLSEFPQYSHIEIPTDLEEQKRLLRSLMNIRPPHRIVAGDLTKNHCEQLAACY